MDELKDWMIVGGICFLIFMIVIFGGSVLEKTNCEAKWADSGKKYDWSFFAGCRVSDKNGNLIPEKNIREVQ
jgi:hypothetical protein